MAFLLPAEVNILGTTFRVEVTSQLADDDCGETVVVDRVIRISNKYSDAVQIETFYHELVHAILGHAGLNYLLDERTEEALAQGMGMALTYVVTANNLPKLNGRSGE